MNITLIGMPGVGKSFIGRHLADKIKYSFIDIDELIEIQEKRTLQDILDKRGKDVLIKLEESIVLSIINKKNSIISPGGSIIYSKKAMECLKENSIIIFLYDSLENIKKRIKNELSRGIIGLKEEGWERLFQERNQLYEEYADVIINIEDNWNKDKICEDIMGALRK